MPVFVNADIFEKTHKKPAIVIYFWVRGYWE